MLIIRIVLENLSIIPGRTKKVTGSQGRLSTPLRFAQKDTESCVQKAESVLKELKRFARGDFLRIKMRLLKTNSLKMQFDVIVRGWFENR